MIERIATVSPERKEEEFLISLKEIVEEIARCEIPIALVGGIPLEAYLGGKATGFRKNGTVRDVDAIAYCRNERDIDTIKRLNKLLRDKKRKNPFYPEVSIEPLFIGKPKNKCPSLNKFLSEIYVDYSKGIPNFYLHFGTVTVEIPSECMDITKAQFGSVDIPTVNPVTLWFFYFIRGVSGTLKPKDFRKIGQLYDKLDHSNCEMNGYEPFNIFTSEVRKKYPERSALFSLFWNTLGEYFSSLPFANELKERLFQT